MSSRPEAAAAERREFYADLAVSLAPLWEKAEKKTPSQPQIYVGAAIKAKLAALEKRLAAAPGEAGTH